MRLVGAVLCELNDDWAVVRRYILQRRHQRHVPLTGDAFARLLQMGAQALVVDLAALDEKAVVEQDLLRLGLGGVGGDHR